MNLFKQQSGQSITEVVVALAIMTLAVAAVGSMVLDARRSTEAGLYRLQASLIASEGIEAVRSMRDGGVAILTPGDHGLIHSGGVFVFSGESDEEDKFTRTIHIEDIDVSTKRITSTVVWDTFGIKDETVEIATDLTDRQN